MTGNEEQLDDFTLIRLCLRGQRTAQKALYERFSQGMLGLCYRYARNRADAEDMLQEGFIKVFTSLNQFRSEGSLEGWIRKIMVNTAINYLNKNKNLLKNIELEQAVELSDNSRPDDGLQSKELLQLLHRLPVGYRTILNLYAIEGYSHKEIGEMMGISEGTSRSQYFRAKEMLVRMRVEQVSEEQN